MYFKLLEKYQYQIILYTLAYFCLCFFKYTCNTKSFFTVISGNPCPAWQPFLCQSSEVCIALDTVCDGHPDCPDHFDEDAELCNASK